MSVSLVHIGVGGTGWGVVRGTSAHYYAIILTILYVFYVSVFLDEKGVSNEDGQIRLSNWYLYFRYELLEAGVSNILSQAI